MSEENQSPSLINRTRLLQKEQYVVRAASVLRAPESIYRHTFELWKRSMECVWGNPNLTAQVLEELGPDAAEVFILSGHCRTFLEAVNPGCTADLYAMMKPYTINEDGTVVLTPEEE